MNADDPMRRISDEFAAKFDAEVGAARSQSYHAQERAMDYPGAVTKFADGYFIVSDDQLMDMGVIPDTRPPVHTPWHRRLRWRWQAWRERAGRNVGGWIAGVDLSERDW
jgi:hypothetical protein